MQQVQSNTTIGFEMIQFTYDIFALVIGRRKQSSNNCLLSSSIVPAIDVPNWCENRQQTGCEQSADTFASLTLRFFLSGVV